MTKSVDIRLPQHLPSVGSEAEQIHQQDSFCFRMIADASLDVCLGPVFLVVHHTRNHLTFEHSCCRSLLSRSEFYVND